MQKNIVILGAGFGGLRCALNIEAELRRYLRGSTPEAEGWKVILVDRNAYQLYSPRLYELIIPGRKLSAVGCQLPVSGILRGTRVEFVQGEVKGVDCKSRVVEVERPPLNLPLQKGEKKLKYDYLILALGAGTDYFGIEGLEKYSCTLKSVEDAGVIRERVVNFLQEVTGGYKKLQEVTRSYSGSFNVVVGGAGATGVEVAAELAYLFRNVPREKWSVTLVEALSTVLWMFPKPVGEYAYKRLTKLGVHTMLDTCIKRVEKGKEGVEVVLAPRPLKPGESEAALACDFLPEHEKRISADLLLWAGGVRATPLLAQCALPVDRKGRMEVDEYLRVNPVRSKTPEASADAQAHRTSNGVKNFDNVFAIGDDATLVNPKDHRPVPATAQAAIEQGRLVAENVTRLIKRRGPSSGRPDDGPPDIALRTYKFHDFPAIIPLANRDGVALAGRCVIRGFPAWFLRQAADCRYFASILGWWRAMRLCTSR